MSLYLYLNEHWHANTWVGGGKIPINPASTYRSVERAGIFTPDENLIHKSEVNLFSLKSLISFGPHGGVKDLTITNSSLGSVPIPDIRNAALFLEDGLILSFSSRLSRTVACKMKKTACVKILDIQFLRSVIDEQLGVASKADFCEYTTGHERNHFLKSDLDSWQAEFRLFWPITHKVEVNIPSGIAELVCIW
jgi:hypothetical protein